MCGICGQVNYESAEPVEAGRVAAMTATMVHRGPDGDGIFLDGTVGLGHRRLTIIGRHRPSTIRLTSRHISACHCLLWWDVGRLWVVDLLSGNGTRLNGEHVEAALVNPGDTLKLGPVALTYEPPAVQAPEVEPEVRAEPAPDAAPAPAEHPADPDLEGMLVAVLDDLGSAHHRPFSRA